MSEVIQIADSYKCFFSFLKVEKKPMNVPKSEMKGDIIITSSAPSKVMMVPPKLSSWQLATAACSDE